LGGTVAASMGGGRVGAEAGGGRSGESRVSISEATICVGDLMTKPVPAVPSHLSMAAARKVAALRSATHLLVEAGGRLVGVLDDRALAMGCDEDFIATCMAPLLISVGPMTTASRARELLVSHGADSLLVVAGIFVVGSVGRDRIERALADSLRLPAPGAPMAASSHRPGAAAPA
jgi:CBS domain-containing protein